MNTNKTQQGDVDKQQKHAAQQKHITMMCQ